jgi:ABC-type amino acid transport substrate-binding protein
MRTLPAALLAAMLLLGCARERRDTARSRPGEGKDSLGVAARTGEAAEATAAAGDLPIAVQRTRERIRNAIAARDEGALRTETEAARPVPFSYSFGGEVKGGAVAYWKLLASNGVDPLVTLQRLIEGRPVRRDSLFVWPAWFDAPLISFSPERRDSMEQLMRPGSWEAMRENGFYIGPRTAIRADGVWMYYVSGD